MNIVLDFTAEKALQSLVAGQPLAVMPAELAKKLLKVYADKLSRTSTRNIMTEQITLLQDIRDTDDYGAFLNSCISFIQERDLIDHVAAADWDHYAVEPANYPA